MISWDQHPEIIDGMDPAHLVSVLGDLEESEGWKWLIRCLDREASAKKKHIFNSIGANPALLESHDRNVYTAKTLECVSRIVEAAREFCQKKIKQQEK